MGHAGRVAAVVNQQPHGSELGTYVGEMLQLIVPGRSRSSVPDRSSVPPYTSAVTLRSCSAGVVRSPGPVRHVAASLSWGAPLHHRRQHACVVSEIT